MRFGYSRLNGHANAIAGRVNYSEIEPQTVEAC